LTVIATYEQLAGRNSTTHNETIKYLRSSYDMLCYLCLPVVLDL